MLLGSCTVGTAGEASQPASAIAPPVGPPDLLVGGWSSGMFPAAGNTSPRRKRSQLMSVQFALSLSPCLGGAGQAAQAPPFLSSFRTCFWLKFVRSFFPLGNISIDFSESLFLVLHNLPGVRSRQSQQSKKSRPLACEMCPSGCRGRDEAFSSSDAADFQIQVSWFS